MIKKQNATKVGLTTFLLLGMGAIIIWKFPFIKSLLSVSDMGIKMKNTKVKAGVNGLDIFITPVIENPQKTSLTITQPFVRIYDRNAVELASSNLSSQLHTIKPISVSELDPVSMNFSWMQIADILAKVNSSVPSGVNKALYIATNWKRIVGDLGLQMKIFTHANGIYYNSEPMKLSV